MKNVLRCFLLVLCVEILLTSLSPAQVPQASLFASGSMAAGGAKTRQWMELQRRVRNLGLRKMAASSSPGASGGIVETIAGTAPTFPEKAFASNLGGITGIAQDSAGDLYVASQNLRCVFKVDTSGTVTVVAGIPLPAGPAAASGDGGPATAATFASPSGLAVDSAGNLYISDTESYTVRKVSASTGLITTIAGTPGTSGTPISGAAAAGSPLSYAVGLAVDNAGDLFIEDGAAVEEVNLSTGILTIVAGGFNLSEVSACVPTGAQTCPATSVQFSSSVPNPMIVQNGVLYLAGYLYGNSDAGAVFKVQLSTGTLMLMAGGYAEGGVSSNAAIGAEINPQGITADGKGDLWFTDAVSEVYELPAGSQQLTVIAGNGMAAFSGDGGPATSAELIDPFSILSNVSGGLLFADSNRIRAINAAGVITTFAGTGDGNYFGDGGPAQDAGISPPASFVQDASGNIYFSDFDNQVIRRIDSATGIITTIAGNGSYAGYDSSPTNTLPGDGGAATATPLGVPAGLALDGKGDLYVLSEHQGIRIVDLSTGIISTLNAQVQSGFGILFDGNSTLYVSDFSSDQLLGINTQTGVATVIAGSGRDSIECPPCSYGDGGPALQATLDPFAMALDSNGNLYVADAFEGAVRIINLSTGMINRFAGIPNSDPGFFPNTYSGDGGPADLAKLFEPSGLEYDGMGNLLIADSGNNVIRAVNLSTDIITTVAGDGRAGYSGDGGSPASATFNYPESVLTDASGNLWIADTGNDRIRRVVVTPAALTPSLAASATSFAAGNPVTFTATYTGETYGIAPAAVVTFYDGTTSLGTGTIVTGTLGAGTPGSYAATLTSTSLAAGVHNITAQFAGDVNYAADTSNAVALTVTTPAPPPPPTFTIAATPTSLTIAQGASGTATFTVTPQNGFNEQVTFSCGTGLPTGVSCSFSPGTVTPNGTSAVTSTLTITTTGATAAALRPQKRDWRGWGAAGGTALASLLCLGFPTRRRKPWQKWLMLVVCLVATGAGAGCGGSSPSEHGYPASNATPAGTYTLTVTANAGAGASAVSQPVSFSLTVAE